MRTPIERLFIEEGSRSSALAAAIEKQFPHAAVTPYREEERELVTMHVDAAPHHVLFIARHRGRFVKPFPRHPWYLRDPDGGCGYNLLIGFNCSSSCSYCFTQTYFEHSWPTLYSNVDDLLEELSEFLDRYPDARVSTGEFTDSLFLDDATGTTERIITRLGRHPRCTLELRTKSDIVDQLPPLSRPNVIAAWSINPADVIRDTETRTAGLGDRLAAAARVCEKGYRIALRIDPIIMSERYLRSYAALADTIAIDLPWKHVSEVHLGAIRFDKRMIAKLAASPAGSGLLDTQPILCPDGKFRPHKFIRIAFYKTLVSSIRRHTPDVAICLTMEPPYVRDAVFSEDV